MTNAAKKSDHQDNYVMLHLGLGSFHRAHQAVYFQELINQGETNWSLAGANIRPDMEDTITKLQQQNGAYTLETITPDGTHTYETIQSIQTVISYTPGLTDVIQVGAQHSTRIISFTVTEGGYYLDEHNRLDITHKEIKSDIEQNTLLTIYGAITAILRKRKANNSGAITLLSCDNLRSNGDRFRSGLIEFLRYSNDLEFLAWVENNTSCPNSMVDRITPRPSEDVRKRVSVATGWNDKCALMAESFIQWVVEDHFCNGRPALENVGVEMVESVLPYEEAKIRILNSTHICIAWAGALKGLTYIHEGVQDHFIHQMAHNYVVYDVIPCLSPSPIDLHAYLTTVLDRFSNPYLCDTNQRPGADGFSKVPGFLLPTLRERLASHHLFADTAMILATFFVFLQHWNEGKLNFQYQDPALNPERVKMIFASDKPLIAFCNETALWAELTGHPSLIALISQAHSKLTEWLDSSIENSYAPQTISTSEKLSASL
ncbi:MAG: D-arabinitol 4-dehydrogenase [Pseudomonadota bacterium]